MYIYIGGRDIAPSLWVTVSLVSYYSFFIFLPFTISQVDFDGLSSIPSYTSGSVRLFLHSTERILITVLAINANTPENIPLPIMGEVG